MISEKMSGAYPPRAKIPEQTIEGVVPALVTPFDDELSLNTKAIPDVVEPLLKVGIAGLFVCGGTGEPTTMTVGERKAMAETTLAVVANEVPIIVHVGGTDLEAAITLARHAEGIGATAISSLPPLQDNSFPNTVDYYTQIGSSTDLPFYPYWRGMTNSVVTPQELLEGPIPNFNGIKFTDPDLPFIKQLGELAGKKLNLLTGFDDMFVDGLAAGSDGGIGATFNIMPKHFIATYDDVRQGRLEDAALKQSQANELIGQLIQYGVIPGIKAVLNARGIPAGPARPGNTLTPYTEIQPTQLDEMLGLIEKHELA